MFLVRARNSHGLSLPSPVSDAVNTAATGTAAAAAAAGLPVVIIHYHHYHLRRRYRRHCSYYAAIRKVNCNLN